MLKANFLNNFQLVIDQDFQNLIDSLYKLIQNAYQADNRPWVIGYSGGKDSTVTLQSIWYALSQLPVEKLTKKIYVISSDTYVETPVIVNYIDTNLDQINTAAKKHNLPIEAHKVTPEINNTFWVNMLGRGYPAPWTNFRWCTDRLKIAPANRFINNCVTSHGEVVVVLGVRKEESSSRSGHMSKRKRVGEYFTRHHDLTNAWVFSPIEDWYTDEVWRYLLTTPSPWEGNNQELATMYKNAQDGECPLIIDKSAPSCGNSRFGCWVCTVVQKDLSMEATIKSGETWLQPLLDFRNKMADTQEPEKKHEFRSYRRRTGVVSYKKEKEDGSITGLIYGPYTMDFRKELLRGLLQAQKLIQKHGPNPNERLITDLELLKIRHIWRFEEGDWEDSIPQIYHEVTGNEIPVPKDTWYGETEFHVLTEVCKELDIPVGLLTELLDAEKKQHGMKKRSQIFNSIDSVLKKDWRSREQIFAEIENSMSN